MSCGQTVRTQWRAVFVAMVIVLLMLTRGLNGGEPSDNACSSVGGSCNNPLNGCSGGSFRSGPYSGGLGQSCVPRVQPGAIKSACLDRSGHVKFYIQRESNLSSPFYTVSTAKDIPKSFLDDGRIHFVIHGWTMEANDTRDLGYELYKNNKGPVIVVDWSFWSGNKNPASYVTACKKTIKAGQVVAQFIYELEKRGYQRSDMHLIGFSLGGKVSAHAGDCLGGQIARITGLDTPLYCIGKDRKHPYLDPNDAQFVDTIRTTFLSGFWFQQQGHADFFVGCSRWCTCLKRGAPWTVKNRHKEAMNLFKNSIATRSCQIQVGKSCPCRFPTICNICTNSSNTMGYFATKPSSFRKYPVPIGKGRCDI